MADEAASFSTDTLSISAGLSVNKSELLKGTLSTNIKGAPPLIEVNPLILNSGAVLGLPLAIEIFKFGIKPCKPCPTLAIGLFSNCLALIASTAPVKLARFCVP
ncbi:hypothetical protein D3C73_941680 [compost metagenome]